jgi:hypothetical protein
MFNYIIVTDYQIQIAVFLISKHAYKIKMVPQEGLHLLVRAIIMVLAMINYRNEKMTGLSEQIATEN